MQRFGLASAGLWLQFHRMVEIHQASRRFIRFCAAAGLACLCAVMAGRAQADDATRGLLTITFDDANWTQYRHGLPVMREYGVPGTLFVISGRANEAGRKQRAWGMTWAQVAEFRDAGWEIGSHSVSHPSLPGISDAEIVRELDTSRADIEQQLHQRPVSFASPYGDYDARTLSLIGDHYANHVLAWGGTEGRNRIGDTDPGQIGRMQIDLRVDPEAVCAEMRRAAERKIWLVLMFHGFSVADAGPYETPTATLRDVVACAAHLRDSGRLNIVTLRDGMAIAAAH